MTTHLSAGQRAMLDAALVQRQRQIHRRLVDHLEGLSRADHAHEVLQQDSREAPRREGDREVDVALSDIEVRELGEVSDALRRLHAGAYGRCIACDAEISFDRLKVEPHALRCVACEGKHERLAHSTH